MFLAKKKPTAVSATIEDEEIDPIYDEELETIEYLRSLDKKDYDKIIKKAEIYREADEAVAKLDGKKAAKKAQELLENEYTE